MSLRSPHALAIAYRRSLGGADLAFVQSLRDGRVLGSRSASGEVSVPPVDWDPCTGAPTAAFETVPAEGVVATWSWVPHPRPGHPLDRPFAVALIRLDGTATCLLHAVDAGSEAAMHTGLRVVADWRAERTGSILDIRAFVPAGGGTAPPPPVPPAVDPLVVESAVRLQYTYEPGLALSRFLEALAERRIEGGRCPSCTRVYVPPRSRCPECRSGPLAPVAVAETGTVDSYTVVHLTGEPFTTVWVLLDGADVPFAHLYSGAAPAVGQRVVAVWVDDADLVPSWESIRGFAPL